MVEGKFSCSIYSILVYLSCVILCFLFNELIFINMIGALAGDIIGSVYEFNNIKTKDFPLFSKESFYTDDSIMTIAVADWLLHGGDLVRVMQYYGSKYPFLWVDMVLVSTNGCMKRILSLIIVGEMVRQCVLVLWMVF